jgi:hypothetical protein
MHFKPKRILLLRKEEIGATTESDTERPKLLVLGCLCVSAVGSFTAGEEDV